MKRIFEFDNGEEGSYMRFINESDIERDFNVYGFYRQNENFKDSISEYRTERNQCIQDWIDENPMYTTIDIKEQITCFQEKYEWSTEYCSGLCGRPTRFYNPEEEKLIRDLRGWYDNDGFSLTENDLTKESCHEFVEEWDSDRLHKTYLTGERALGVTEVTGENEGVEYRLKYLGSNKGNDSTMWREWYIDSGTQKIWKRKICLGEVITWEVLTGDDKEFAIGYLLQHGNEIPEFLKKEALSKLNRGLKRGEKIILDNGSFCFTYRGEKYHYSWDQLCYFPYEDYFNEYYFQPDLKIARQAIEKRRIEAVQERLAKNNYEAVLSLPLQKIFVEYEDSIESGNCEAESSKLRDRIAETEKAMGNFATRADILLQYRDDNYSRRAVLQAFRRLQKSI